MKMVRSRLVWGARLATICLEILILTGAATVWAGEPNPSEMTLDWQMVRALVVTHPAVRGASHDVDVAKGAVRSAGAPENPALEGAVGLGKAREGDEKRVEWGIALSIPVDWIATRGVRVEAARQYVRTAEQERIALQRDLLLALRLLFWEVLYNQERVRVLEQLVQETDQLMRIVSSRVANGESRRVEEVQMRVVAGKIRAEQVRARAILKISREKLGVWFPSESDTVIVAVGDVTKLPSAISDDDIDMNRIIAAHPDARLADAQLRAAQADVTREEKEKMPEIAIAPFFESELDRRATGLGLSLSLPLWQRNQGNIESARHRYLSSQASLDAKRMAVHADVLEFRTACRAALDVANRYRNEILPDADVAAATIRRTYELGETTLFEAISAGRMSIEIQLELIDAALRARQMCSRYDAVVGKDI